VTIHALTDIAQLTLSAEISSGPQVRPAVGHTGFISLDVDTGRAAVERVSPPIEDAAEALLDEARACERPLTE
jgi:hypothetical protein